MDIAVVTWGDAYIDTIDINYEDACELQPLTRVTVGFLIESNDTALILCTDHYESDGQWFHSPMVIPAGMILNIRIIPE
jgi:hypothetical protein|tara:strand:- start:519 stop:755 length:237 start_codon:yes stop_codon:yes gene_type:complete